ncbi:hypothetical protein ABFA07_015040 [Porites harrisoni]
MKMPLLKYDLHAVFVALSTALCPSGWFKNLRSCYKLSENVLNWQAAKKACEDLNSTLAIISSEAEHQALKPYIRKKGKVTWIGLHRNPRDKKRWLWVDGSRLNYTHWGYREPNNITEECVEIRPFGYHNGGWNDQECSDIIHYICEKDVNGCASNPCKNGATCANTVEGFNCTCTKGFQGEICDKVIKPSQVSPYSSSSLAAQDPTTHISTIPNVDHLPATSSPFHALECPLQWKNGVLWFATRRGQTDIKPCPEGATGSSSRTCSKAGNWRKPNFTGCASPEFLKLANMAGQNKSQMMVNTMDAYGLGVAATLNASTKMVFQSRNLMMRIDYVDQNSPLRKDGLQVAYNQSSIFLPPQVFHSSQDSKVVTLVYLTLGGVLSLKKRTGGKMFPRTTIVSSTVEPRPLDNLENPVKIILQNRKVLPRAVTSKETHCVFWRPKEPPAMWKTSGCQLVRSQSNASITTCECDHLTVFAALMDPYGLNTTLPHKQALEIISIIGCSISLFSVLLTMAVTLVFWREIKGSRVKVLLNLCAAIACSCILAILEGSARNKEPECTVVAALLHYFLLALFSWMLCEGILHYIVIVRVLHGHAEDKVKFFYLFGWGFPAIMVIISLSVTQLKRYGHKEACWLNADEGLIWAFIVPALGVILVNIVVFILVMRQMMGTKYMQNKTQVEKVRTGVKASGVILPLLGITWLFGLLSFNSDTIIFKYIFTIFNSLQGLMIFIFHCVLNKQIKDAFKKRRRRWVSTRHDKRTSLNLKNKFEAGKAAKDLSNPIKDGVDELPEIRGIHSDTMKFSTFISQDDVGSGVVQDLPLEGNINLTLNSDD